MAKGPSRAKRAASVAENIRQAVSAYQTALEDLLAAVEQGASDTGELAEEMGSWRDNMEEKFSATDKFQRVSEAAEQLETVQQNLEGWSAEDGVEELKSALDELEQVDFPGMFG